MVVLLIQRGANGTILDGEGNLIIFVEDNVVSFSHESFETILGCASIHLAAQMGHTAIVAYLVAKRVCDVNFQVFFILCGAEQMECVEL